MLIIHHAASDSRGIVNEDVVGHCGAAAWVIDGATGTGAALMEAPSDAAWLARTADAALRRCLEEEPEQPTVELVRRVILACREAMGAGAIRVAEGDHEHPSAAFAMIRRLGDMVELTGLADCRIAYRDAAGVTQLFSDTSLDAVESTTLAVVRDLIAAEPEIAPADLFARVLPQLRANRRQMNRPGGYWVLGTEPAAADRLARRVLPVRPGQRFVLASDGALRPIELFETATVDELLAIEDAAGGAAWLNRLRALEAAPGSCRRVPRVKIHDDASILAVEIAG